MHNLELDVGFPRWIVTSLVPLVTSLVSLSMGVAALLEQSAPKGTFLWLAQSGLSTSVMIGACFACGALGLLFYRRLRLDRIGGVLLTFAVTFPYLFFVMAVVINNVVVTHLGSLISIVSQFAGYIFLWLMMLLSTVLTGVLSQQSGRAYA